MCKHSCENSQLVLYADGNHQKTVSLNKNTGILGNTESLVTYAKACVSNSNFSSSDSPAAIPSNMFREILLDRRHVSVRRVVIALGLTKEIMLVILGNLLLIEFGDADRSLYLKLTLQKIFLLGLLSISLIGRGIG